MKTLENLIIYWLTNDGHEEVVGLYFYVLFKKYMAPTSLTISMETNSSLEFRCSVETIGEDSIGVCAARIGCMPPASLWKQLLVSICEKLGRQNAKLIWMGDETCTPNPLVLKPGMNYGNVYGVWNNEKGLIIASGLDEEMKYLEDRDLEMMWKTNYEIM
ncbi:MAG: hypothetical protein SGI71_07190 [Verrucomicrobiota bacterium]|nr:hypothetical protein [Verrucomicrobiota bacterium]